MNEKKVKCSTISLSAQFHLVSGLTLTQGKTNKVVLQLWAILRIVVASLKPCYECHKMSILEARYGHQGGTNCKNRRKRQQESSYTLSLA